MAVDPKIIYLEADEEVTSVVDKLRKTEFKKVVFVVPKEASLLQSVINLKLLKRQAENLEKSISIVTHDKVGRNLAEKVGIIASSKIDEKVKAMEPVLSDATIDEEIDEAGPLAETKEIVFKKEAEDIHENWQEEPQESEDIVLKESDESAAIEGEPSEKDNDDWSKTNITENKDQSLMPKIPHKKAILVGGVILAIILFAAFILLPRAKVTIIVAAAKKQVSVDFKADKSTKLDTEKDIIPATVIEATGTASKKFTATGKRDEGTKATGSLQVANLTASDIDWTAGTRFYPNGYSAYIFRANSEVLIGKGKVATVSVTADQPGDKYNGYASQEFKLTTNPALAGVSIFSTADGTTGGTTKTVTFVTQADINAATTSETAEAYDNADGDFVKKVGELKMIDSTKKKEVTSQAASPNLNEEANDFTMTVKVSEKVLAYDLSDVSKLIKADVNKEFGFAKQIINDGSTNANVSIGESDLTAGTFSGTIQADAYVSSKLDTEAIKADLVGQNQAKAENSIKSLDDVTDVKSEFWPSFIKIFPRLKSHIFVTIEIADSSGGN